MQPVRRLEAMRETEAARALGRAMAQLRRARERLAQLEGFAREYRNRMLGSGGGPVSGRSLQGMARFQDHLDGLIRAQARNCREAEEGLAAARRNWQARHARHKAVVSVEDRFRQQETLAVSRKEQRELDELGRRKRIR